MCDCACSIRDNSGDPEIRLCVSVPVGTGVVFAFVSPGTYMLLGGRIFDPIIVLLKGTIRPD